MRLRELVAIGGIATLALAGCGGGGDDGAGSGGDSDAPATTVSAKDQTEIEGVSAKLETAAKAQDGKGICALLQPALIDDAFGSRARCARQAGKAISRPGLKDLQIKSITPTSTGVSVSFKNAPGRDLALVKVDGIWYIDLSGAIDPNAVPTDGG